MPKQVGSMQEAFESINEHDEVINEDILPRLREVEKIQVELKKSQEEFTKEIALVRHAQSSLELTVMKDGDRTRALLERFVDHYFGTDDKKLVMREKVTLKRLSTKEKIVIGIATALGGTGGVLAGISAIIQMMK